VPSFWGGTNPMGSVSATSSSSNVNLQQQPTINPATPSSTSSPLFGQSNNASNSSFVLLTDTRVYTLQAPNPTEQQEWLTVIKQYLGQAIILSGWLTKVPTTPHTNIHSSSVEYEFAHYQ